MAGLPRPARNDADFALAALDTDPQVGHRAWFEQNRNRTFHYSRLGRRAPIARALRRAGPETGAVDWGRTVGQTRFHFADQVEFEWLPPGDQQEDLPAAAAHTLAVVHETLNGTGRSGRWLDPSCV